MDTQLDLHEKIVGEQDLETFQITNIQEFTWYASKLELNAARINEHGHIKNERLAKLQRIFDEEIEKINADYVHETTMYRNNMLQLSKLFGVQALAFIKKHLAELKGKHKSFKVGSSSFGFKKESDKFKILDQEKLIAWAYANGHDDMVKVESKVMVSDVTKYYKEVGEIPDGFEVEQGDDRLMANINGFNLFATTPVWGQEEEDASNGNDLQQSGGDDVL